MNDWIDEWENEDEFWWDYFILPNKSERWAAEEHNMEHERQKLRKTRPTYSHIPKNEKTKPKDGMN